VRRWPIVALLFAQGCASSPRVWSPDSRTNPASCVVPAAPDSVPWQLVVRTRFTFCVPPDWRLSSDSAWSPAGGSITWGTGQGPIWGVPGVILPDAFVQPRILGVVAVCHERTSVGTVEGNRTFMLDVRCADTHYTFARFSDPAVYFLGHAQGARMASLELAIYRTVRFVGSRGDVGAGAAPPPN